MKRAQKALDSSDNHEDSTRTGDFTTGIRRSASGALIQMQGFQELFVESGGNGALLVAD